MLIRYTRDSKGRTVKKAVVYTLAEHGIRRERVDADALRVVNHLRNSGYEAYIVGGAVRDLLIGKTPKDFDIVTDAEPTRIKRLFRNSRIIGRRFRLVHIFFGDKIFEVSTFRSLSEGTIGNSFGTMDEDVQRRDFTMNALYFDPLKEQIVDYVNGVRDIRARTLQPVIPLKTIFRDDPVRMLRAVKYAATTGCSIPFRLGRAIRRHAQLLGPVSPSRLTEELVKIISSGHSRDIVNMALKYDLFMYLQPAAASLIDGNPAFAQAYEHSLARLDELHPAGEHDNLGRRLVYLITDLVQRITDFKGHPVDVYNEVYRECRRFIMPMNPPRVALEFAVRYCLKEGGLNLKKGRGRLEGERPRGEAHDSADTVPRKRRRRRRGPRTPAAGTDS